MSFNGNDPGYHYPNNALIDIAICPLYRSSELPIGGSTLVGKVEVPYLVLHFIKRWRDPF